MSAVCGEHILYVDQAHMEILMSDIKHADTLYYQSLFSLLDDLAASEPLFRSLASDSCNRMQDLVTTIQSASQIQEKEMSEQYTSMAQRLPANHGFLIDVLIAFRKQNGL